LTTCLKEEGSGGPSGRIYGFTEQSLLREKKGAKGEEDLRAGLEGETTIRK